MNTIIRLTSLTLVTALAAGLAGCIHVEDPAMKYVQRTDKIALGAGNAKDANVAIHMIDPWPRASADRRIPANGERMAGAYERYRNVDKPSPRPLLSPPNTTASTSSAAAAVSQNKRPHGRNVFWLPLQLMAGMRNSVARAVISSTRLDGGAIA